MKGQILLVSHFMAQGTKVYLCKLETTKKDIMSFVMPKDKHLAPFVDLILTLVWDLLDESVFFFLHHASVSCPPSEEGCTQSST